MITGCFGLLAAAGDVMPELHETIHNSLQGVSNARAPWDAE